VPVEASQLGAIRFLSPQVAVALTTPYSACKTPPPGQAPAAPTKPVRLAISRDGGRTWLAVQTSLPRTTRETPTDSVAEQLVATSTRDAWALTTQGQVAATQNGGTSWTVEALPRPVVQLKLAGRVLWALSCPQTTALFCRPVLERKPLNGAWTRLPIPQRQAVVENLLLAVASPQVVVLQTSTSDDSGAPNGTLASSIDGGQHWTQQQDPTLPGGVCYATGLTTAGRAGWWLLCSSAPSAGHSLNSLLRTTDGGRVWATMSDSRLSGLQRAGTIPGFVPTGITASSPSRVWLGLIAGWAETADAGAKWTTVPRLPGGTIDVLSATRAWILVPDQGIWRTTDGSHWRLDGPVDTGPPPHK
jgi:photosystem II stability/assembly factor-like uncharacterized protein